jgi:integrase
VGRHLTSRYVGNAWTQARVKPAPVVMRHPLLRATVNRETGALKQAFNLARKQARLTRVPYIPMLREDNARQRFFEHADFEKLVAALPDPIDDIGRFGYLSDWRRGEIVGLTWDAVDRQAREVRLRTSKNGQGRVLPLDGDLWNLMERRWNARAVQKKDGTTKMSELVFHRSGEPWRVFASRGRRRPRARAFRGSCSTIYRALPCGT